MCSLPSCEEVRPDSTLAASVGWNLAVFSTPFVAWDFYNIREAFLCWVPRFPSTCNSLSCLQTFAHSSLYPCPLFQANPRNPWDLIFLRCHFYSNLARCPSIVFPLQPLCTFHNRAFITILKPCFSSPYLNVSHVKVDSLPSLFTAGSLAPSTILGK